MATVARNYLIKEWVGDPLSSEGEPCLPQNVPTSRPATGPGTLVCSRAECPIEHTMCRRPRQDHEGQGRSSNYKMVISVHFFLVTLSVVLKLSDLSKAKEQVFLKIP